MLRGRVRILLVSSAGGVLLDLLALESWWKRYTRAWAAVCATDTCQALVGEEVYWIQETSVRHPFALARGLVQAWRICHAARPDVVVSAGAGCAVPFFVVATLIGIPTVWLSTFNVLTTPGVSGAICGRLASLVLLQRSASLAVYPRGVVVGELY
jgi:hypothetical protein